MRDIRIKHRSDKTRGFKGEDGFTLLEVIMAISILTVGLLAVASMQVSAMRGNAFSMSVTESTDRVQDVVEKLLALNINSTLLNEDDHDESELDLDASDYQVKWTVQDNTPLPNVKKITVTVEWQDRGVNKQHTFELLRTRI